MTKAITRLEDLQPDPHNANRGTERGRAQLDTSLRKYGAGRSILADKDGTIIAGNKTLETAADLGLPIRAVHTTGGELIVVVRDDLSLATDPAARELAYADNRVAQVDLDFDPSILLADQDAGIDLSAFWSDTEIRALLEQVAEPVTPGAGGDEFDATPQAGETRVQPGDIWQVGVHRVGCLSGTDPDAVARLMGDERADMVFADPPYGIDIVSTTGFVGGGAAYDIPFGGVKNRKQGLGSTDGAKPFGKVGTISRGMKAKPIIEQGLYEPVIGDDTTQTAIDAYTLAASLWPKAVHIWWGGNYYANALPPSSCWIVWDKENGDSFFADAELAWTNQPTAVRIFRHMWNGLMKASERGERRVHPTQKPVALAMWCYEQYGKHGDVVFDPCAGSGISLIAAERLGRKARLCELSPAYCDVVLRRAEAEGIGPIERIAP